MTSQKSRGSARARVLEVARQIGYRPSRHARALVAPAVDTIGVIVPDMVNPFYPELIQGVIDAAAVHDWRVVVTTSDGRPEDEARLVTSMSGQPRWASADSTAVNVGIAAGALLGGLALTHAGAIVVPIAAAVVTALGVALVLWDSVKT